MSSKSYTVQRHIYWILTGTIIVFMAIFHRNTNNVFKSTGSSHTQNRSGDIDDGKFGFMVTYRRKLLDNPEGLKYQSPDEAEYLQFHKCQDHGEVYSASYLITKTHLLTHKIDFELSKCNTELASFMLMDTAMNANNDKPGTLIQSLDVLDFSVIHLSAFERLQRRHSRNSKGDKLVAVKNCTNILHDQYTIMNSSLSIPSYRAESYKTVVVMPWLGSETGAGNSHIGNRLEYLKACFWSFYLEYPYIVVAVKTQKDEFIIRFV